MPDILKELLCGGLANAMSSTTLNMFDSAKTRMQLQPTLVYKSLPHALQTIYKQEGLHGLLTPGLAASIMRELSFSSFRFGLYSPTRNALVKLTNEDAKQPSFLTKFISAISVGLVSSAFANPTDLVKIRIQSEFGKIENGIYTTGLHKGQSPTFRNTIDAFRVLYNEG